MWVVVEVVPFGLEVDVGVVDDVVLFHELFGVVDQDLPLASDRALLYVDRDL